MICILLILIFYIQEYLYYLLNVKKILFLQVKISLLLQRLDIDQDIILLHYFFHFFPYYYNKKYLISLQFIHGKYNA